MTNEAVVMTTAAGQNLRAGVQPFDPEEIKTIDTGAPNPNSIRWLFNPFAFIDTSARPHSGHRELMPGAFIPITNKTILEPIPGTPFSMGLGAHQANVDQNSYSHMRVGHADGAAIQPGMRPRVRTAHAISSELEDAYSDKGVKILNALTGFTDMAAADALHATLIAPGLIFSDDPNYPNTPVPNLVHLEAYLRTDAMRAAGQFTGQDLSVSPVDVVNDVLLSVQEGLKVARGVTNEAKRVVANKTQGYQHTFDAWHARCFIALGQSVPSDLPYEGMKATGQTAPVQTDEVARLRAENEQLRADAAQREIDALRAENERLRMAQSVGDLVSRDADAVATEPITCNFVKPDGTNCKVTSPIDDAGRCRYHPLEQAVTDGTQENENGNEESIEV
jgi:hypothetical protein